MKITSKLEHIPTKLIFMVLSVMIVCHLIFLSFYTQQHQQSQAASKRSAVIQQVMNIIHMVEATPPSQLSRALKALDDPNISVSLSSQPKHTLQANVLTFWRINKLVPNRATGFSLSLHLPDSRWLNLTAKVTQPEKWPQYFLLLIEFLVTATVLFYAWSISRFTKPLQQFQKAAHRLGMNITTTELEEVKGPAIVRETAQAMNIMQKRIKDLLNDRTLLLAAISHDLRTPITRLKLRASKIDDASIYQKTIQDLDEMESMIAEILDFARTDESSELKIKLDLNSFLETICFELSDLGYPVQYKGVSKRVPFYGRRLTLKRAINNLIQNAVKYGNEANVTLKVANKNHIITVDDKGPGIESAELEKVFAPFYRCEKSRSRAIGGTGLGLATARDAIRGHGGDITLKNLKKGGLRVIVTLNNRKKKGD